jgi:copper chaperone CopZ
MNPPLQDAAFAIEGMHCGACVRRLTTTLSKLPGVEVRSVEIGNATLAFDPQRASAQAIRAAIEAAGFTAGRLE